MSDPLIPPLPAGLSAEALLAEIARCPIMQAHLRGTTLDQPCRDIVLHQWMNVPDRAARTERWEREHHLPEPWLGHLSAAPILFVSSNPNLQTKELRPTTLSGPIPEPEPLQKLGRATPEDHPSLNKPYRAPKFYWPEEEVRDLYESMFDVWASDNGTRRLSANGSHRVPYWAFAYAQAAVLLPGRDVVAGRDYALTEVVHCKSASEGFVKEARRPCVDRYLEAVLAISPAAVVFIVGLHAARAVEQIDALLPASRYAADASAGHPGQCVRASLADRERLLAYVPHPGWLDRNPEQRAMYELPDAFGPEALKDLTAAVRRDAV